MRLEPTVRLRPSGVLRVASWRDGLEAGYSYQAAPGRWIMKLYRAEWNKRGFIRCP